MKILFSKKEQIEVRECLLSIGAESFLSSSLLSKNINFKIHRAIILPVVWV